MQLAATAASMDALSAPCMPAQGTSFEVEIDEHDAPTRTAHPPCALPLHAVLHEFTRSTVRSHGLRAFEILRHVAPQKNVLLPPHRVPASLLPASGFSASSPPRIRRPPALALLRLPHPLSALRLRAPWMQPQRYSTAHVTCARREGRRSHTQGAGEGSSCARAGSQTPQLSHVFSMHRPSCHASQHPLTAAAVSGCGSPPAPVRPHRHPFAAPQ
jgi:hypothetical protein